MDILIRKFTVRYNGEKYEEGQIIKNIPDDIAKELEANSSGNVILLDNSDNSRDSKEIESEVNGINNDITDDDSNSEVDQEGEEEINLPDVNLNKTVKQGGKGNAKK